MVRKVFRAGNSIVVSLPREIADQLNMTEGADVSVELDKKNRQILIRRVELPVAGDIDAEFAHQVADFIQEYRTVLESLARK